ncbi:hypothetical protein KUTeg_011471 [Tegillarca granosa]|uniref:Fibrinogen C-terminal domain-containing protein n=1 Tax=Tegillarca granosa TaxID=220873 RepID=A0ABQ9F456_TEGGR|nr:hypothetical protein KUTeg_011471 [Tegillarca granosa]
MGCRRRDVSTSVLYLSTILLIHFTHIIFGQNEHSACRSSPYHQVSFRARIEHQCVIVETLQQDYERDKIIRDTQMTEIMKKLTSIEKKLDGKKMSADCHELIRNGITVSGVYPVKMPLGKIMNVWCDMETDNGGWTIIQRRFDGSVNFKRSWDEYTFGFGNANSEYWIGLENMYQMAAHSNYSLRIDIWDWENNHKRMHIEFMFQTILALLEIVIIS